jgi:HNH endonuclease
MTLHFAYPHLGVVTVDHVVARVRGGTDRDDNLATCCFDCNNRKRNRRVEVFLRDLYLNGEPGRGVDDRRLRWRVARVRLLKEAKVTCLESAL